MALTGLTLLLVMSSAQAPTALHDAVKAYWDALARKDKAGAMEYVVAESRNTFIQRRSPSFQTWRLGEIVPAGAGRFTVRVKAEKVALGHGFFDLTVAENWVLADEGWKVEPPPVSPARRIWESPVRKPKPGLLRVLPSKLKIHFISSDQKGVVLIENGLDKEVRIERVDLDTERFQLLESPETVPAGSVQRLVIRHTGSEANKNLNSEMTLYVQRGSTTEPFTIPVEYNVVSRGTRALFGLTVEDAEGLKGVKGLTPSVQFSKKSRQSVPRNTNAAQSKLPGSQEW